MTMANQTAAQVKAQQQEEVEAATAGEETKSEETQQDSGKERTIDKPEMRGGVPLVRWDDPNNDPTKRQSVAKDPTGVENRKLLADTEE